MSGSSAFHSGRSEPIAVGVSGHQNLGRYEQTRWVQSALASVISILDVRMGYTCLAAGTDQLFSRILLDNKIPYTVVVPCLGYETTFQDPSVLISYRQLAQAGATIVTLPHSMPSEEAYWEAGKYIVNQSDWLVVVWDGQPARGLGGTGDVVQYAISHRKSIVHINHELRLVQEISPCQS